MNKIYEKYMCEECLFQNIHNKHICLDVHVCAYKITQHFYTSLANALASQYMTQDWH